MLNKLSIFLIVLAGAFLVQRHFWPASVRVDSAQTAKTVPAYARKASDGTIIYPMGSPEWCKTYCEPEQDSRTQAQWEADCDPAWARKIAYNGAPIDSMWCRTPYNNKFDYQSKLPADWRWL